jgi:hypothetical protein
MLPLRGRKHSTLECMYSALEDVPIRTVWLNE